MRAPVVCFSHLRWDFVYQRPNHLMARAARECPVWFVEEPERQDALDEPAVAVTRRDGLTVVRPRVPARLAPAEATRALAGLVDRLVEGERIHRPVTWYYTPMALPWTEHLPARAVVYDVMDELRSFRGAPPELLGLERRLLRRADLVFTGGRMLHEAKRALHRNVHLFPSSVDRAHFAAAREAAADPADQAPVPHPRLGYHGVIDERLDLELLGELARRRPGWQFVLVGPIAKIDPADIPDLPNVHHLGLKPYAELPAYLAGWDVAIMPFARNEATRHISPTKTPEYLAGGRAVVSTSIADVVEPYGRLGLARIADDPDGWEAAVEDALAAGAPDPERVDAFLARTSWDRTWAAMRALVDEVVAGTRPAAAPRAPVPGTVPVPSPAARGSVGIPGAVPLVREPVAVPVARASAGAAGRGPRSG